LPEALAPLLAPAFPELALAFVLVPVAGVAVARGAAGAVVLPVPAPAALTPLVPLVPLVVFPLVRPGVAAFPEPEDGAAAPGVLSAVVLPPVVLVPVVLVPDEEGVEMGAVSEPGWMLGAVRAPVPDVPADPVAPVAAFVPAAGVELVDPGAGVRAGAGV
jgi:hypothetical protein